MWFVHMYSNNVEIELNAIYETWSIGVLDGNVTIDYREF